MAGCVSWLVAMTDFSQRRFVMVCSCILALVRLNMPVHWGADLAVKRISKKFLRLRAAQYGAATQSWTANSDGNWLFYNKTLFGAEFALTALGPERGRLCRDLAPIGCWPIAG
jgi:hypothetical protein